MNQRIGLHQQGDTCMSEMIARTKRLMIRTLDETDYETVLPLLKEGTIASQYAD